jgi:hypothetical protein
VAPGWEDQNEAYCLDAVKCALLADRKDLARRWLGKVSRFRFHTDQANLLERLGGDADIKHDHRFRAELDSFFDLIRSPMVNTQGVFTEIDMLRLQFGALRDKYVFSEDGKIDWRRVIASISE